MMLRNYTHTAYRILPDIAAKVINAKALLSALPHPEKEGAFTLRIPEGDDGVKGSYSIEWGGNDIRVREFEVVDADLTLTPKALARAIYGYDVYSPLTLPYLDGAAVNRENKSIYELFRKKPVGLFEHF
jgi:hypothetical protein